MSDTYPRAIKFRAKLIDSNEWIYGGGVQTFNGKTIILGADNRGLPILTVVKPETVGQYVDRKDKSEIEIYEADIVNYTWDSRYPSEKGVVKFGTYELKTYEEPVEAYGYYIELLDNKGTESLSWGGIEIIGNIYEKA